MSDSVPIDKTYKGRLHQFSILLREHFKGLKVDTYADDYDEEFVYFEMYSESGPVSCYRMRYTEKDGIVSLEGGEEKVIAEKTYRPITSSSDTRKSSAIEERMLEKTLRKILSSLLGKESGDNKTPEATIPVVKAVNTAEMKVIESLYLAPDEVDLQKDTVKREGVEQIVKAFNEAVKDGGIPMNLFHKFNMDKAEIDGPAWINEKEYVTEEGEVVKAGQPLVTVKFKCPKLFAARVGYRLGGLSIRGLAVISKATTPGAKREIKSVRFPKGYAHCAYTSWDQGGAASDKNKIVAVVKSNHEEDNLDFLLKPVDKAALEAPLSEYQRQLLLTHCGFTEEDLSKSTLSQTKEEEDKMSEEKIKAATDALRAEFQAAKDEMTVLLNKSKEIIEAQAQELAKVKAKEAFGKYGLEADVLEELIKTVVPQGVETVSAVVKALDAVMKPKAEKDEEEASGEEGDEVTSVSKEAGAGIRPGADGIKPSRPETAMSRVYSSEEALRASLADAFARFENKQ